MNAPTYFFLLSAVYIAPNLSSKKRLWFGGVCLVTGVLTAILPMH